MKGIARVIGAALATVTIAVAPVVGIAIRASATTTPGPTVLLAAKGAGSGDVDTKTFTVPASSSSWRANWSFRCSPMEGNFDWQVMTPSGPDQADYITPNQLGLGSHGTESYTDTGTFYLDLTVDQGCSYAVQVVAQPPIWHLVSQHSGNWQSVLAPVALNLSGRSQDFQIQVSSPTAKSGVVEWWVDCGSLGTGATHYHVTGTVSFPASVFVSVGPGCYTAGSVNDYWRTSPLLPAGTRVTVSLLSTSKLIASVQ